MVLRSTGEGNRAYLGTWYQVEGCFALCMLVLQRVQPSAAVAPEPSADRTRWQKAGNIVTAATALSQGSQTNWTSRSPLDNQRVTDAKRLKRWELLRVLRSPAIKDSAKKVSYACLLLALYMGVGIAVYIQLEDNWSSIDAAYFCMATMSTVGYGDISPTSASSKAFTVIMIFTGALTLRELGAVASYLSLPTVLLYHASRISQELSLSFRRWPTQLAS